MRVERVDDLIRERERGRDGWMDGHMGHGTARHDTAYGTRLDSVEFESLGGVGC